MVKRIVFQSEEKWEGVESPFGMTEDSRLWEIEAQNERSAGNRYCRAMWVMLGHLDFW